MCIRDRWYQRRVHGERTQNKMRSTLIKFALVAFALLFNDAMAANCSSNATQLISFASQANDTDVYMQADKFLGLTRSVLQESCIAGNNTNYCNDTLNTLQFLTKELARSSSFGFDMFEGSYVPFKPNLIGWVNACAVAEPAPVEPSSWNYTVNESVWCGQKTGQLLIEADTLLNGEWSDKRSRFLQTALDYLVNTAYCFDLNSVCSQSFYNLRLLVNDTVRARTANQWNNTLLQYRENVLSFIIRCSPYVNTTQPTPTPNTTNDTCSIYLQNATEQVSNALNQTSPSYDALKDTLKQARVLASTFNTCVVSDRQGVYSKKCKSRSVSLPFDYLKAIQSSSLPLMRARAQNAQTSAYELVDICKVDQIQYL
eukprot:TRINITY_DN3703_c0_g1_i1.p1 TRINITY_DN3703_c0_g1~~TRINITY_DN3703_c0_g1_i1.p1  ORF type:complete len:405 (+),score=96.13 TRINITY_DN3703_c0_g1_i1:104-1216(+)